MNRVQAAAIGSIAFAVGANAITERKTSIAKLLQALPTERHCALKTESARELLAQAIKRSARGTLYVLPSQYELATELRQRNESPGINYDFADDSLPPSRVFITGALWRNHVYSVPQLSSVPDSSCALYVDLKRIQEENAGR